MARAIAKYIRMSPRKLRRVINVVRGKHATDAKIVLKFMPYAAARVIEKVLSSAVANAKNNENLNPDELKISKAYVDGSTTLRRWRAMSRGRGFPILKRTSHVTVEVEPSDEKTRRTFKDAKFTSPQKLIHKHEHKHDADKHKHEEEDKKETKAKKKEKEQTRTGEPAKRPALPAKRDGEKEKKIEQKAEKELKEKEKKTKEKKKKKDKE